jgi:hypothetical protein
VYEGSKSIVVNKTKNNPLNKSSATKNPPNKTLAFPKKKRNHADAIYLEGTLK